MQISDTEYQALADRLAPKSKPLQNCLRAFLCGGAICVLGQGLLTAWQAAGLPADRAATLTSVSLIFLSALLTGLSVFAIAGPVLVYGLSASVVYGLLYWIFR